MSDYVKKTKKKSSAKSSDEKSYTYFDVTESNIDEMVKHADKIQHLTINNIIISEYPQNIKTLSINNVHEMTLPFPKTVTRIHIESSAITDLDLSNSSLTSMEMNDCKIQKYRFPDTLKTLSIGNTNLGKLDFLPDSITSLTLHNTNLLSVPNLPSNLRTLNLDHNKLIQLPDLPNTLEHLSLNNNHLAKIPDNIIMCGKLIRYTARLNPIVYTSDQLLFLYRFLVRRYYDGDETVSDPSTLDAWKTSIKNLLNDKVSQEMKDTIKFSNEWVKQMLTEHAPELKLKKKIKWCRNPNMYNVNTNIETVWLHIWNRIFYSPHKKELIKRFVEEITDANNYCDTGYKVRLVNVLAGFYDDIKIGLNLSQHLGEVIANERKKALKTISDPSSKEFVELWKRNIITAFGELDVKLETLSEWIKPISAVYDDDSED